MITSNNTSPSYLLVDHQAGYLLVDHQAVNMDPVGYHSSLFWRDAVPVITMKLKTVVDFIPLCVLDTISSTYVRCSTLSLRYGKRAGTTTTENEDADPCWAC